MIIPEGTLFMKNIQLTDRETDLKVLAVTTKAGAFVLVGGIVWLLTLISYGNDFQLPFINFLISIAAALFVWSTFKLVEPFRYSRNWQIAEFIFVPLVWLLLMVAIDVGIYFVIQANWVDLYSIITC
jgi:hypothetical protein